MSSFNHRISRKRPHSPNYWDNSDSDDDSPPVKLKSDVFGANASIAFTSRLKKLVVWCSTLPVTGFFQMAFKAGANLRHEEIVLDDDDDDDIVIEEDKGRQDAYIKKLEQVHRHLLNKQRQRRELERNGPQQQQRYPTRGSEITCDFDSRFDLPHQKTNGSSSVSWRTRSNTNGHNLKMLHIDSSLAPVSNPSTDIEILLDSDSNKCTEPESEIEIISESGSMKPKPTVSQRPVCRLVSKSVPSSSSSSSSSHNRAHSSKHYTADEVNRLHEKEQYKLLLDKYIDGTPYHNISKKRSTSTDELLSLEITGAPFKKEVLNQPITSSFIDKYRKPIQLVNTDSSVKAQEPEVVTIDDDEDECEFHHLPKFKPRYKSKADSFSSDFLNELRNNVQIQTRERLKLVEKYEKCIEDIRQKRLLQALNFDKSAETGEPELPALTPAMEEDIDLALRGDPEECVSNLNGSKVFRKDIETLDGLNWLNDLIINTYLDLIVERSKSEGYPSVYAYNTFFYTSFKTKGYAAVRRWTRKVDIFSYDLNFIPLHLGLHWALGVIDHRSKKISYYDSMGDSESKCLDILYEYLSMEHRDKKNKELDVPYTADIMKGIPQQMNGSDCGMFTLKYAEYISRDAEITFSQKDMAYFRRRMIYELLCGKILC